MNITHKFIFAISLFILSFIFFSVLELNKNRIIGWIIGLTLIIGFIILFAAVLNDKPLIIKAFSWPLLIAMMIIIVISTQGPFKLVPAVDYKNPQRTDIIKLPQGKLTGVYTKDKKVEVFTGIPYAKPPIGDLRWKEPADPGNWSGILKADHFAPMSMQPNNNELFNSLAQIIGYHDYKISLTDNYRHKMSEDSLYLNIWKPADTTNKTPVLVYIHGGSLKTGQPWYKDYSGEAMARNGVIVVNMGYRLGIFGYFADEELANESPNGTTGNYGTLDQIKALEWVKKNIASFGGDENNITLAGESAGAASVSALTTSPLAKGLFNKVIAESSSVTTKNPPHSYRSMDQALKDGASTKKDLKVKTVSDLRKISSKKLVSYADTHHHITIDGYALTESPYNSYQKGIFNGQIILQGYNSDESGAFLIRNPVNLKNYETQIKSEFGEKGSALLKILPANTNKEAKENYKKIFTAYYFGYSHYRWVKQTTDMGIPTYEYLFSKDNKRLGAWHSGEEVYLYGNIPKSDKAGANLYDNSDLKLEKTFNGYVLNFIKYGNPNGKATDSNLLSNWPLAKTGNSPMELGRHVGVIEDPYLKIYKELDKFE